MALESVLLASGVSTVLPYLRRQPGEEAEEGGELWVSSQDCPYSHATLALCPHCKNEQRGIQQEELLFQGHIASTRSSGDVRFSLPD